ncbi:MAG: methyltransferase domain-containing protein [Rhizobiales bacterium]|nr:methyltransferase domain-containing protein [Hyphomicrobiales bacterium]
MSDWSDGYVTSTEYTTHFYPFLSPASQNLTLLLKGVNPPDLSQNFAYCELGCGQGFSTALLAAANPKGSFVGVDFNPAHVAGANQLKAAAQIQNVAFLEKSFAELGSTDLPMFDYIALHGVWSWISRENREAIASFVYSRLKPGGIVYISYNAMPGWAPIGPLRQLFVESQRHKSEIDVSDVNEAIELAGKMRQLEAGYFKINPAAGANLDHLSKLSRNYLLHEYFNGEWQPFYFSDVAADLRAAKLGYACSSDVLEHIDQLCFGKEQQAMLATLKDGAARETIRDYFRNQRFRRDLFSRGARQLGNNERTEMLRKVRLAKVPVGSDAPAQVKFSSGRSLAHGRGLCRHSRTLERRNGTAWRVARLCRSKGGRFPGRVPIRHGLDGGRASDPDASFGGRQGAPAKHGEVQSRGSDEFVGPRGADSGFTGRGKRDRGAAG